MTFVTILIKDSKAKSNNVEYLLSISVDLKNFNNIHKITQKYNNIWCTTGVHPNNVPKKVEEGHIELVIKSLKSNLRKSKVIGLGETGLDYFREEDNKVNQINFLKHTLNYQTLQILQLLFTQGMQRRIQ